MTATLQRNRKPATIKAAGFPHFDNILRAIEREQTRREIKAVLAGDEPKRGCLMAMCPSLDAEFPLWAADRINPALLADDGIETEPHITVLYGFKEGFDPSRLADFVRQPEVTLGRVTRFERPEYDVLKVDVTSPDLEEINAKLTKEFAADIIPSEHDYHPHLTLAYVQKGACLELDGSADFDGRKLYLGQMVYSPPDRSDRKVFDVVKAAEAHPPKALTERQRYAAHIAAQDAAEKAHRRAVLKAIAYAEGEVLAGKAKKEDDRAALAALLLLFLTTGAAVAYISASNRLRSQPQAPGAPTPAPTQPLGQPATTGKVIDAAAANEHAKSRRKLLEPFARRTVDRLEESRQAAERAGESQIETIRQLDEAASELEEADGERVAETEAQATYGSAQLRLLKDAGFATVAWVTMDDERVRDSHRRCEEQGPVPIGTPFQNGLLYPGDPHGGPEEVINCRCMLVGVDRA